MSSNTLAQLLPLVGIGALFWFLAVRPAKMRQRAAAALQDELRVGATVMLTSGVYGQVRALADTTMSLAIAPQVTIVVHRNAVGRLVTAEEAAALPGQGFPDVTGHSARPAS